MKSSLTETQSRYLVQLGVRKEIASERVSYGFAGYDPRFTLTDLLKILPKEIEDKYSKIPLVMTYGTYIEGSSDLWFVYYDDNERFCAKELIDALYELLIWVIKNGYLRGI